MEESLKQYIDLYHQHAGLIDSKSSGVMNSFRPAACKALEEMRLPREGEENYEITDLASILKPDYGVNVARIPLDVNPAESFRCGVPHLSNSIFLLINDLWGESIHAREALPEGVEIGSLKEWTAKSDVAAKAYASIAPMSNPIVALDTLLAQDGLYMRVTKGTKLQQPIQLVNILQSQLPLMAIRRILIIIEEDAEAQLLICDHSQNDDTRMLALQTIEILAGRNSKFDLYDLEESSEKTTRLSTLFLHQEEGSNVLIDGITLFNGHTRNEYHTIFRGPDASLKLLGMGIEDGDRRLDSFSNIQHAVGHCFTEELFKYVIDDRAKGAFAGRITVDEGAVKTEAYQTNRNIVGSDDARMFSKPQLEIYNDDVKCSHGSAIGQLDQLQVFYMRSRGLSDQEARLLLKQAFMTDVIEGVRMPVLKSRIRQLVDRRFAGENVSCKECNLCIDQDIDSVL